MLDAYPVRSSTPEIRTHHVRLLGTGANAPTKEHGPGVTVTRTSEGLYKLAWAENPGVFIGLGHTFGAATPGNMAGHTCARDTYDSTAFSLEVRVADASDAADDLEANEYLDLQVHFKQTSV